MENTPIQTFKTPDSSNSSENAKLEILNKLTPEGRNVLENAKFDFFDVVAGEKTKEELIEELSSTFPKMTLPQENLMELINKTDFSNEKKKRTVLVILSDSLGLKRHYSMGDVIESGKKFGLVQCSGEVALLTALKGEMGTIMESLDTPKDRFVVYIPMDERFPEGSNLSGSGTQNLRVERDPNNTYTDTTWYYFDDMTDHTDKPLPYAFMLPE